MTERLSDLTAQINDVAPKSKSTHKIIHRKMLASRKITPEFNSVLINVIKIITPIKTVYRLFVQRHFVHVFLSNRV